MNESTTEPHRNRTLLVLSVLGAVLVALLGASLIWSFFTESGAADLATAVCVVAAVATFWMAGRVRKQDTAR